ncbi:MAG: AmmeMemoRadiSam system radical SAM enzyme [Coriobacteriia bacterium]|nr:AmmeMemoRadiSam system radical SAM enzyme [Coriobacteriia bacterium]
MEEAILYTREPEHVVVCGVCNHRCRIKDGKRGICGVRENSGGVLYALNYGKAVSVSIDPIEKKPLFHFMPGTTTYSFATVGCNFKCDWCQNWEISQSSKPNGLIMGSDISPQEHVAQALDYGCPSISYTYTEPTIFIEYALDTMKVAREAGLKNVWVSNGYMTPEALEAIAPYLDAINVDFKGPDDAVYQRYCGGRAKFVMENLVAIKRLGIHLEITTLVIPEVNDRKDQLRAVAEFIAKEVGEDVPWHISRFFPAWKMPQTPVTPIETLELAAEIGRDLGLEHIHIGNV